MGLSIKDDVISAAKALGQLRPLFLKLQAQEKHERGEQSGAAEGEGWR